MFTLVLPKYCSLLAVEFEHKILVKIKLISDLDVLLLAVNCM